MSTMADQLAFDLPEFAPPPPVDLRPPCAVCGAPSLANVYGFQWYQPRKTFVSGPRDTACRDHLETVTEFVLCDALGLGVAVKRVWSLIHQPGDLHAVLPTGDAWHELEVIEP